MLLKIKDLVKNNNKNLKVDKITFQMKQNFLKSVHKSPRYGCLKIANFQMRFTQDFELSRSAPGDP